MKNLLLGFCLLCIGQLTAQNYADLLKVAYAQTFSNNFEGVPSSTQVTSADIDLTVPLVLNDQHVFITGGSFNYNQLQLYPEARESSLYSTLLKVGLASTYSEKWSSTLVLLPKVASDYENITGDDFYLGGFALLKYHKKENLIYRFGAYGSQEAFGFFATPIFGWYYLSNNGKFEMDMSLPISADMNYTFNREVFTLGVDYYGIGRSFNLTATNTPDVYVDVSSLEFASYLQYNGWDKSVLLRAKLGYSSNNFEVYNQGETIDLGLSAFSFGDDRTQLNPTISGGFFFRFEAIYRFHLPSKEEVETID